MNKTIQRALFFFAFSALVALAQPLPPPFPARAVYFNPLEALPWESSAGQLPKAATNLNTAPSWDYDGTTLSIDTNVPAFLQLDVLENGKTNVTLDSGSLEIWCQPNWTSTADGGSGPGTWATLWDIGSYTPDASVGAWLLTVDPSGSNVVWVAQVSGGNQVLSTGIDFDTGDWHQIVATWSATNACLYVDGELMTNSGPILYQPSSLECSNDGFCVGSLGASGTNAGTQQFQGQLQWLASYAQSLSAEEVAARFLEVAYYIDNFGYNAPGAGGFHSDDTPTLPGSGFTGGGGSPIGPIYTPFVPPAPISPTNYSEYNEFYLTITNDTTNAYVSISNTLSNLTYVVLTNSALDSTNWVAWQVLRASNGVTPAPAISLSSNAPIFFEAILVAETGTNGLPDWWQMQNFGALNVDPYADPDGDGLCNLDEWTLGTDPNNAHSLSALHNDAQALFLAHTNFDAGCRYQLYISNAPDTNTVLVTISPTLPGTNYQLYTQDPSSTNNPWIVATNILATNTSMTIAIPTNGAPVAIVGGYGEDSDGDGLPDGYEVISSLTDPLLPDTGLTGTPDGYKDPDGDGYANLQEMYNGTNPHVFNTPAGAINLAADYTDGGDELSLSWQPASGPVTGYLVSELSESTGDWIPLETVSATQFSYLLTDLSDYGGQFAVSALYSAGRSLTNFGQVNLPVTVTQAAEAHGLKGKTYLLVSVPSTNVSGYNAEFIGTGSEFPELPEYWQSWADTSDYDFTTNISASQFTNGTAVLPEADAPLFAEPAFALLTPALPGGHSGSTEFVFVAVLFVNVPFIDGTQSMKENLRFLLRVAAENPFGYQVNPYTVDIISYPSNYVYSSYYYADDPYNSPYPILDHFAPFEDNYFFRNFAFGAGAINSNGTFNTGFYPSGFLNIAYWEFTNPPAYQFPTYDYVISSNLSAIAGILSSNSIPWVGSFALNISTFGAYESDGSLAMSNYANVYGLPYTSLNLTLANGVQAVLSPTNDISGYNNGYFSAGTEEPELRTVDYYFARPAITERGIPGDPLPNYQDGSFSITNATPSLMLGSVGTGMLLAGYAKQAVLNGYTNVFAYLGQYFSNALVMSNGIVTTNSAGILSEYGEFFPTVPGEVALQTMPDPDQGNTNGTCVLDIIRLSLDVNHDGIMDESYTGPDNTSAEIPYVFWANNDYDRWDFSLLDGWVEDDVADNSLAAAPPFVGISTAVPDYDYVDESGSRAIPCPRDLEDFTRLWISGISTNVLARLPTGSTVTLNWGDVGEPSTNNPTIDIFQAADADGSIGYLTNLATASNQINNALCQYVGQLGPGSNVVLNSSVFSNNWAGNHFIWCGVFQGSGTLYLTIADGSGNVLAQSPQSVQIQDIKQMYERWTVGDAPGSIPMSNAIPAIDNFSPGYPATPFQYLYDPAYDTNDDYILFVHGYNMESWEKDRFAETAYKRLYWQGYQGRFGSFRWPTYQRFYQYDVSETKAWNSGQGLKNLLTGLNSKYPGNVYVLAHSMGNVVTAEALRQAGTDVIVNTYVASQAALSARAYDNTLPADLTNQFSAVKTPDSEGHYYTNNAPPYFNVIAGATHFVDFYNPVDWALNKWIINQAEKPDLLYYYVPLADQPPFFSSPGYFFGPRFIGARSLQFTNDTYEIFSRCVQSYSYSLGADTNVASLFNTSLLPINLQEGPFNFSAKHPGHSQQFRFDNMTTQAYWSQLLQSFKLNINPD